MLYDQYLSKLQSIIVALGETQRAAIGAAAEMIVACLQAGGCVHLHDTGHMLNQEAFRRAGGFFFIAPFSYGSQINNPVRPKAVAGRKDDEAHVRALIAYSLHNSNLRPGDVLIIGSVSGKSTSVVELATQAAAMGVQVIAITSLAYSRQATSSHSSGKRLFEVAHLTIDNVGEEGDAVLTAPHIPTKLCPTSGITAALIVWLLTAQVAESMVARGLTPQVWKSVNLPGSEEFNQAAEALYHERGF